VMQFGSPEHSNRQNFKNFKIQDGGGRHIERSRNRHMSAAF